MEHPWRAKLNQARTHLERYEAAARQYVADSHFRFEYDRDPVRGALTVTLRADAPPPMILGVIVGDVLHNLRSALDAIAWETCSRAGVPAKRERDVYFPITESPTGWGKTARQKLPRVAPEHRKVFRELQPWHYDQMARDAGVDVPYSHALREPLYRLDELARLDRHRVPHPIAARAGLLPWLGTPLGVEVTLHVLGWPPEIGQPFLEWICNPPSAVNDVEIGGEPILAFSEEDAANEQSAGDVLKRIIEVVTSTLRRLEVDVLEIVTSTELAELEELRGAAQAAENAIDEFHAELTVLDRSRAKRYTTLRAHADNARNAYVARWRALFE